MTWAPYLLWVAFAAAMNMAPLNFEREVPDRSDLLR